jgi:hypothetical protein
MELKFYNFSIEKLIELSKDSNSSQFLAKKQSGEYEVMYFSSDYRVFSFYMTEVGEYIDEEYYPEMFAML